MTAPAVQDRQTQDRGEAATVVAAGAARAVQLRIRAQLMSDVVKVWPVLDPKRIDTTWPGWLLAMKLLIRSYHGQSAVAAGESYRKARELATQSPAPRSLVKLAPAPADEWMTKALGYSGPGMLNKDTARPGTALTTTLGTASRIMLDGSRTTIVDTVAADPVAVGWYRLTDGDPCWFCALLATRGHVYKETSFDLSDPRFTGSQAVDAAKVHNSCGCTLVPSFSRTEQLPAVSAEAAKIYADSTGDVRGADKRAAFRDAWNARNKPAA